MDFRHVLIAILLLFSGSLCAPAQLQPIEWEDGTLQEQEDESGRLLEYRALEVERDFPWLVQEPSGLAVSPNAVPREEFLRGIHAASELVFDGTSELPGTITLQGFYPNIDAVLAAVVQGAPGLRLERDEATRMIRFVRPVDPTVGLSEGDLIARYRRPFLNLTSTQRPGGIILPGALFIEGNAAPPPFAVEVTPNPMGRNFQVSANGLLINRFSFLDPLEIDRNLMQAQTMEKYREALKAKTDLVYWQVSQIPYSTSGERLHLTAAQLGYTGGLFGARVEKDHLAIDLADGSRFTWRPEDLPKQAPMTEVEAYQAAFQFQNLVLTSLASGNVVFCSDKFGFRVGPHILSFGPEMDSISGDPQLSTTEKERQIRLKWPDDADWILEYFYTSIVKDVPPPPGLPLAAPPVGPLPTPITPPSEAPTAGGSEDLIQQFLKERGLPPLR